MASQRIVRKLAARTKETQETERNSQLQNTFVGGMTEEYITQSSEEIVGRVTEKLSEEFSRTESRVAGALPKPDEIRRTREYGHAPEPFRKQTRTVT